MLITHVFDETGINPDNYIDNEIHSLLNNTSRLIVPYFGLFYTNNLEVINLTTSQPYVLNTDYKFQTFVPELTARTGLEIAGAIELINPAITTDIKIKYHAVGGLEGEDSYLVKELIKRLDALNAGQVTWDMVKDKPQYYLSVPRPVSVVTDLANLEAVRNTITDIKNSLEESRGGYRSVANVNSRLDNLLNLIATQRNDINKLIGSIGVITDNVINALTQDITIALPSANIYPDILTPNKTIHVAVVSTGVIRISINQKFVMNGFKEVNTSGYSQAALTFPTAASKLYHLRFNLIDGFVLKDLSDPLYNPSNLEEASDTFDSNSGDMLIARVISNSGNVPTVKSLINSSTTLINKHISTEVVTLNTKFANDTFQLSFSRTPINITQSVNRVDGNAMNAEINSLVGKPITRYGGVIPALITASATLDGISVEVSTIISG